MTLNIEQSSRFSKALVPARSAIAQAFAVLRPDLSPTEIQVVWEMENEMLVMKAKSRRGKAPDKQPAFATH